MLYLHIIDTHNDDAPIKSMYIENENSKKLAQIISFTEKDNIIIVNEIVNDPVNEHQKTFNVKYVYMNGKHDLNYSDIKINKKNN